MKLEVEGEEVGGQILPHFYCEDMMNVMNKVRMMMRMMNMMRMMMMMMMIVIVHNGVCKIFLQERRREALSKFVGIIKVCCCF